MLFKMTHFFRYVISSRCPKLIVTSFRQFCQHPASKKKNIVVALSGGVDSSAAAILLKEKYGNSANIQGVHIRSWMSGGNGDDEENTACPASTTDEDFADAQLVADALKIKLTKIDLVRDYWLNVFEPMLADYCSGLTPNPDIVCNQAVKFGALLRKIDEQFGCDAILATGHYAQIEKVSEDINSYRLLTSADSIHDQTFFLAQVPSAALSRAMFPVGHITKDACRKIVSTAFSGSLERINQRLSSAGLCFVGRRRSFANFIDNFIPPREGRFLDVDTNSVVGTHSGRHHFAIGQRVRIPGVEHAYYVVDKQLEDPNDILVASGAGHPALFTRTVTTSHPFWIGSDPFEEANSPSIQCHFRFQHQHPLVRCELNLNSDKSLVVNLTERSMRAVSPGQYAVFYLPIQNGIGSFRCLGSARIVNNRPTLRDCGVLDHQPMHQKLFA